MFGESEGGIVGERGGVGGVSTAPKGLSGCEEETREWKTSDFLQCSPAVMYLTDIGAGWFSTECCRSKRKFRSRVLDDQRVLETPSVDMLRAA